MAEMRLGLGFRSHRTPQPRRARDLCVEFDRLPRRSQRVVVTSEVLFGVADVGQIQGFTEAILEGAIDGQGLLMRSQAVVKAPELIFDVAQIS